jgi:hypothetical protein
VGQLVLLAAPIRPERPADKCQVGRAVPLLLPSATQWRAAQLATPVAGQWYALDIADLYNAWQTGIYPNYGIQFVAAESGRQERLPERLGQTGPDLGVESRMPQTTPPLGAGPLWTLPGVAVSQVFLAFGASNRNGCARGWVSGQGSRNGTQEQEMCGKPDVTEGMKTIVSSGTWEIKLPNLGSLISHHTGDNH